MMMTCGLDSNSVGVMQVADRRPLYPVIDHQAQFNCPRAHPCSWNRECLPAQERTKQPESGYLKIETMLLFLTDFRMHCSSFRSQILPTERQKFVNIGGCSSDFCNFSHIFFLWTNFSNTSPEKGGCCVLRQAFSFYNNISSYFFTSCTSELSDYETCVYHIYFVPPIPVQCQHSLYLCESCPLRTIATPKHKSFTKVSRKMQYIPFLTSFHHVSVKPHHAIFETILLAKNAIRYLSYSSHC